MNIFLSYDFVSYIEERCREVVNRCHDLQTESRTVCVDWL